MRGHDEIQKNIEKAMENKEKPSSERVKEDRGLTKNLEKPQEKLELRVARPR